MLIKVISSRQEGIFHHQGGRKNQSINQTLIGVLCGTKQIGHGRENRHDRSDDAFASGNEEWKG